MEDSDTRWATSDGCQSQRLWQNSLVHYYQQFNKWHSNCCLQKGSCKGKLMLTARILWRYLQTFNNLLYYSSWFHPQTSGHYFVENVLILEILYGFWVFALWKDATFGYSFPRWRYGLYVCQYLTLALPSSHTAIPARTADPSALLLQDSFYPTQNCLKIPN